jgi:hypothetical protein
MVNNQCLVLNEHVVSLCVQLRWLSALEFKAQHTPCLMSIRHLFEHPNACLPIISRLYMLLLAWRVKSDQSNESESVGLAD